MKDQAGFLIRKLPARDAERAYRFHEKAGEQYVARKDLEKFRFYAEEGFLFGVENRDGNLVGLCYVAPPDDEAPSGEDKSWEVGGLIIDAAERGHDLGELLIRFAVGFTLVSANPWRDGEDIIAHVHESNPAPRVLLDRVGFRHRIRRVYGPDEIPVDFGLPTRPDGSVAGDVFEFDSYGLDRLATWFSTEFLETTGASGLPVEINVAIGFEAFRSSLAGLAKEYPVTSGVEAILSPDDVPQVEN